MANENKDIGEIVKKCKILLLDIEGTTTSISFVKDKLFPYAEEKVKQFLDSQWEKDDVKEAVAALRKLALEDKENSLEGVVTIPGEDATKDDQIDGLVKSVKWQMSADRKVGALKQLQGLIWKQGYDDGDIKGHVFDDVSPALEQWHSVDEQKVYIYSSGSVQAQKLLFGQSMTGNLLPFIDGHFDTAVGAKQEAASYTQIAEKIGCKPDEILFLTDIVNEAEAARKAGLQAALVSREGNTPLSSEATEAYPVLHSLGELTVSKKRKPDPQNEVPAKVPKTETNEDVKTTSSVTVASETPAPKETKEPEKMEVEEAVANSDDNKEKSKDSSPLVVEEVTDSNDAADTPVSDAKPIIQEKIEEKEGKTKEKQTEKMQTENVEAASDQNENKEDEGSKPVVEETTVITEVEDISDKQLGDVAEIMDDLEPIVEEPSAGEDMEELQNVGDVLEKECDEILSKVQDVTNLDNIPMKPLLKTIAEETMETENTDTNDIVDRILDRELELEMKQCVDIDLNTVEEITEEPKTEVAEKNVVKGKASPTETNNLNSDVKAKVENKEANGETEKKIEKSTPTEKKAEEVKMEVQKPETECKEASSPTKTEAETKKSKNNDVAEDAKPVAEKVNAIEEVKPEVDEVKPVAEEVKSVAEEVKPVAEELKPVAKEVKPVAKEVKPVAKEVKPVAEEVKPVAEEVKPGAEEVKPVAEEVKPVAEEVRPAAEEMKSDSEEVKTNVEEAKPVSGEVKSAAEDSKAEVDTKVNGNATNGDAKAVNQNGDASKDEELSSRLSVENGKEVVNGSNGDSMDTEQGQGDCKVEAEVSDIKMKTVTTEEPRTDPIEQPSEA